MFASAQFQYTGLNEKIAYQGQLITRLTDKVNKQKQLLALAKEKVLQVEQLENRIKSLEQENDSLKSYQRSNNFPPNKISDHQRPQTIDLTGDDDDFLEESQQPAANEKRRLVTSSFLNQVTKSTTQRGLRNYGTSTLAGVTLKQRPQQQKEQDDRSIEFAKSRLGESTNILQISPRITRPVTISSSGSSARNSLSNGSLNTSFSSHDRFLPPGSQLKPNLLALNQPLSSNNLGRLTKTRASTTNLAQRLSAHMKVGGSISSSSGNRRGGSVSSNLRPGSAFSNHNIFKRR